MSGGNKTVLPVDLKSYNSITFTHLAPTVSQGEIFPNPTRPWLEYFAVEYDVKKRGRRDDIHTCHVGSAEIDTEDKKKTFDILVDGHPYGPFHRVRISICSQPTTNPEEQEHIILPLMTYLPLELP
eukprot:TRINITY_DN7466_c0_g1_i1.p1 TRINITY_DN7466_c0_g1~~TRINITY_DN7466_c0_g1_i1.p1  ORF type:complete len:135 (-),score=20.39 TRINITY_DN7466_c0_g1_i1:100-477(-)